MVLFDADVADQPAARKIVARAAAIARLQQAVRHVARKTLDHGPNAHHEVDGTVVVRLAVAHHVPQFMIDDSLLDDIALLDHVLSPLRIAAQFGQGATTFETHIHGCSPRVSRVLRTYIAWCNPLEGPAATLAEPPQP